MTHLYQLDKRHIWHPFTQMKDFKHMNMPIIKKGEGIKLYDIEGKTYYDCISSWWCIVHGHCHPKIVEAVKKQAENLEQVIFAGFSHEPAIMLVYELQEFLPKHLTRFFFSDNGSTACEVALKMSYQYRINTGDTNKRKFMCFDMGYHGDTIGAMSVSGRSKFNEKFKDLFFQSIQIESPYCYRCKYKHQDNTKCNLECLEDAKKIIKLHHHEVTAMILEPLLFGAGGMILYPSNYLIELVKLLKTYDIHIIFDEVATGFGRLGKMFALEFLPEMENLPDFLCLSKGLTAGFLPLALTITTDEIYNAFYDDYTTWKTFFHGHTFTANPLACTAAVTSLKIFKEENTIQTIQKNIEFLQSYKESLSDLPHIGDVRGKGMILAWELVKDKKTKEVFPPHTRAGWKLYLKGLEKGLILRPLGNVNYLFLPLSTCINEIQDIMTKVIESIKELNLE